MATHIRKTEGGEHSEPKTVLGFYATVVGIVELGVVGAVVALSTDKELRYLVPWVLGFGGLALVTLIGIVVWMNIKAPMKLQLGRVSGREFIAHEQMTLGNSTTGEYLENVPIAIPPGSLPSGTALPPGTAGPGGEGPPASEEDEGTPSWQG